MPRSIFSQQLQLEASVSYNDAIASPHTAGVAEGQTNMEGDLNVFRTLMKNLLGKTNWYDQADMHLTGIANKFFIEQYHESGFENVATGTGTSSTAFSTAISAITNHNNGGGNSTTEGVIVDSTKAYRIAVRNATDKNPIDDGSGNEVYGRLAWNGTSYEISWYSNVAGTETAYNFASSLNVDIAAVVVSRPFKNMSWGVFLDPSFHDVAGLSGTLDDSNVLTGPWSFLLTGDTTAQQAFDKLDKLGSAANGEGASGIAVENAAGYFTGADIEALLGELATQLGGDSSTTYDFSENNVLADNDAVYAALEKLDLKWGDLASANTGEGASLVGIEDSAGVFTATDVEAALKELYDAIQDVGGWEKISETTASPITSGTSHTIPGGASFTPSTGGLNMDVYFSGQLLTAGAGNDYTEDAGGTSIKFLFTVPKNKNITYQIRK